MKRRKFLTSAAVGVAAGTVAAPAVAQGQVRWRMATSWPKSLDTMYGSADALCKRVGQLTDGKFEIRAFAGGEIVPALQVLDAVQANTVECGHLLSSFNVGKHPAFAFDAGLPFGLNQRQQNAWLYEGGGLDLVREFYRKYDVIPFPSGNVGVQMGGWYRKEINSPEDLKGLKFRVGGFGGIVMSKLGVVPQQIATADIYSALERGTIDGAEWIGPYDDEKLGFHKVAKFYYYPGWWEGSAAVTTLVNRAAFEGLPKSFQAAYETAANEQNLLMMAAYDGKSPAALRRLVGEGVQLRQFPRPVMDAAYQATEEVLEDIASKNPDFKKIYEPWKRFRDDANLWFRVAENSLDQYRYAVSARR